MPVTLRTTLTPVRSPSGEGDEPYMLAKLNTFTLVGIEALPVEVEVDVSPSGLPKQVLVGLPEAAVKESTHRVERAMVNSGFQRPQGRIVADLAPDDLPTVPGQPFPSGTVLDWSPQHNTSSRSP